MRRVRLAALAVLSTTILGGTLIAQTSRPEAETWKVGEMIPDLTLKGSDGKDYRLRDYAGKQAIVIAWYPKSFTGG